MLENVESMHFELATRVGRLPARQKRKFALLGASTRRRARRRRQHSLLVKNPDKIVKRSLEFLSPACVLILVQVHNKRVQ